MLPAYIEWLTIYVWLPLLVLWVTDLRLIWEHKKTLIGCAILTLGFGVPWDIWAVAHGMWTFPSTSILGVYFLTLPIEEYFFMIFIALLISTTALILRKHFGKFLISKSVKK